MSSPHMEPFAFVDFKTLALMEWMYENILWLLLFVPLFLAAGYWQLARRTRIIEQFWTVQRASDKSRFLRQLQIIALALTFVGLILAAAQLRKGDQPIQKEVEKAQVILALDISRSMLTRDVTPDRLTLAKNMCIELIRSLPLDQIGSIVFAGNAYVNMPLTADLSALPSFINNVSTETAGTQGTAISEAIELAMGPMSQGETEGKILVIFSDGEEHEREAPDAAAEAAAAGMQIHTVGVGTVRGGNIPIQKGRQTEALKDASGQVVVSRLQAELLQSIAEEGNGTYFEGSNLYQTVDALAAHIQNTAQRAVVTTDFRSYRYYYTWFLGCGLICLTLAIVLEWKLRS